MEDKIINCAVCEKEVRQGWYHVIGGMAISAWLGVCGKCHKNRGKEARAASLRYIRNKHDECCAKTCKPEWITPEKSTNPS